MQIKSFSYLGAIIFRLALTFKSEKWQTGVWKVPRLVFLKYKLSQSSRSLDIHVSLSETGPSGLQQNTRTGWGLNGTPFLRSVTLPRDNSVRNLISNRSLKTAHLFTPFQFFLLKVLKNQMSLVEGILLVLQHTAKTPLQVI